MGLELKVPNLTENKAFITNDSVLLINNKIGLEDLDIIAKSDGDVEGCANKIAEQLYPDNTLDYQKNGVKNLPNVLLFCLIVFFHFWQIPQPKFVPVFASTEPLEL